MTENALSTFLRDRRLRLDPATFGFPIGRRRTPGLRREEVAQRANISPTWYTWLEQGRGGSPSADVLDRIAKGLMLTDPERDHLHILAFGHPPEQHYRQPETITPRLQACLTRCPSAPRSSERRHGTFWHGTGPPPSSSRITANWRGRTATFCV
ncbi:hypothetical protein AGR7C_Lc220090 [Agrobacterium deltaense Zutra 3/1]|uniref:HTH cro/C1-type domain-containing protein n=1 Tax=Agrobacterium deltaense Zutra 3/1 TaxID=1183427 RepID=A0A1S7RTN6_9HYPH|nr:hypothetical protein AGR7C_Lc220090 [Agrobacterium deltaense Zutra 3/1]